MANIVDRRLNPKGKNLVNRQRFINRAKGQIKDHIQKHITDKNIKDIESGNENIKIKSKDVSEPTFRHDHNSGKHKRVLPGNKEYHEGDAIPKPDPQSGNGPGEGEGGAGDSLDEFEFTLSREEFLDCLFEDLELPDFIKESLKTSVITKPKRSGFTNSGSPANLNLLKTFKNSIGRRVALHRPSDEEIAEVEAELAMVKEADNASLIAELEDYLDRLKGRRKVVPYIDEKDLRYNLYQNIPDPQSQAVMFCLMDVSGSMGEIEKDISKRFFLILYLFLERKYDKIDIRFIRHTEVADEVDEHTFFYDRKSGGTIISSGLELIDNIITSEYPVNDWNIYVAQCTDGDNMGSDNITCEKILTENLLPKVQYYAYLQVSQFIRDLPEHLTGYFSYSAWPLFKALSDRHQNLVCKQINNKAKVWQVFNELFSKVGND